MRFNKLSVCFVVVFVFASMVLVQPASARDREFADIYTECGLGAMIAPNNEAVAAVTNVTWDLGTTAISSNISSPESCAGGSAKMAMFIHQSYGTLETELARGDGDYLDALMVLAEYDSEAYEETLASLRKDFAKIVSAPDYADKSQFEKSEALYDLVEKHKHQVA